MTAVLAERFDRVVAVDVSPRMLEPARAAVPAPNVESSSFPEAGLDPVEDGIADVLVCYLVLQHLPRREVVEGYLKEFGRVLAPDGQVFVQLPVLAPAGTCEPGDSRGVSLCRSPPPAARSRAAPPTVASAHGGRVSPGHSRSPALEWPHETEARPRRTATRARSLLRLEPGLMAKGARSRRLRPWRSLWRRPWSGGGRSSRSTLFIVGLAAHNIVMALLRGQACAEARWS